MIYPYGVVDNPTRYNVGVAEGRRRFIGGGRLSNLRICYNRSQGLTFYWKAVRSLTSSQTTYIRGSLRVNLDLLQISIRFQSITPFTCEKTKEGQETIHERNKPYQLHQHVLTDILQDPWIRCIFFMSIQASVSHGKLQTYHGRSPIAIIS
ncbi:unnamed protein product [Lactuca saligna]|uniref:Uncharacterized protein n=1 Tax=Lactuca saligna TaxID=75948 RepID=A0AA35ZT21_LACSI|nr:unnamed protein product [Lactuca saligna]